MTKKKKKLKVVKKKERAKMKKLAIKEEKLKLKASEVKPLMLKQFNKQVKSDFKASEKQRKKFKKAKKQSKILDRKYVAGEVTFPIYVFNSKLERTVKIRSLDELQFMGLHLGTILTCVRDSKMYSKHYFSYNKSIKQ